MKILEMTATFGKLNKATLRPGAGFTLVEAPNEYGKSTWCAFLRAMFYGFPARDRDKAGYIAERTRCQPWSGAAMEGTLTLEWQGRELTIYRGPKGSVPWGTFTAVWTASQEPVEGLTAENCGEVLLGISREVFERTAFVGQGEASLSPSADLEKRIASLWTTGEEVSYSQVERRLKDWLNRRKVNSRVGLIPELEDELAQVNEAVTRQSALLSQAQAARQEKEALETQKAALESKLAAHAAARSAQQSQRRSQAQADYQAALEKAEALKKAAQAIPPAEELRQAQGDLTYLNTLTTNLRMADKAVPPAREAAETAQKAVRADPVFGGQDPTPAAAKAQADYNEAARLKKGTDLTWIIAAVCAAACVGVHLVPYLRGGTLNLVSLLLSIPIALLVTALPAHLIWRRRQKAAAAILTAYDAAAPDDILQHAARYTQLCAAAQEAAQALKAVEAERDRLTDQRAELTVRLLDLVHTFAPEVTDVFGISAALSRALQMGEKYTLAQSDLNAAERLLSALPTPEAASGPMASTAAPTGDPAQLSAQLAQVSARLSHVTENAAHLRGELNSLGDPAELQARRTALMEELDKRRGEYDAIAAAMESMKEADSLLREKFSPAVNEKAGTYLAALTGGKYDTAALNRQFQTMAREAGETTLRQDLTLSGGTVQQLYLAVRLAICELALPQQEPCPLLLDDALDAFDDKRARLALDCLLGLAGKRQVILFSCHGRERTMLENTPATLLRP